MDTFLTHFPRRDVCAEKLTRQLFHSENACKRATRKMCGAFTQANKMCRIDAENVSHKCASVNEA